MLKDRILNTIKFFDLQDYPLTASEVQRYLITDKNNLLEDLDSSFELKKGRTDLIKPIPVHLDTVLLQLTALIEDNQLKQRLGFYTLPGREKLIGQRLLNYSFGVKREKLIRRYLRPARHIPFVRGIALAGSQAMGLQRSTSDIDLLIITDPKFMWLARTFLTAYFQVLGIRRYGKKITNRFCLNHYLANAREVDAERNLYKAMEYAKLRPVVYSQGIVKFQKANQDWIKMFFANVEFKSLSKEPQSWLQWLLEKLLNNKLGLWIEKKFGSMQLKRIRQDKFIFVKEDELSFHPESKHESLLQGFFGR